MESQTPWVSKYLDVSWVSGKEIQLALGDGRGYDIEIAYVVEEEPLGTGGALGLCAEKLEQAFMVLIS